MRLLCGLGRADRKVKEKQAGAGPSSESDALTVRRSGSESSSESERGESKRMHSKWLLECSVRAYVGRTDLRVHLDQFLPYLVCESLHLDMPDLATLFASFAVFVRTGR